MTPPAPAAGWDAQAAAQALLAEWDTLPHGSPISPLVARHLTLARSTAPTAEAMREAAATLAESHRPPTRKYHGLVDEELLVEIRAEERGEKIAGEIIAKQIRALPLSPAQTQEPKMATDTKDWPPKPRPEPPYPTPQADASLRAGEREMLDRILDADDDGDGHDMIRALRDARKLLGRVRQANMAPAQPSAEAMRRCIEQFADHKNWYDAVGCLQWMGKRHAIDYAESVLSALPPAQPPTQPSAEALSSIPAAEIEALRKVVTVELERDEWNHRVATHLRSFLARLQSPTPAGEDEARPNEAELTEHIRRLWLETKPSQEAQKIRSEISVAVDDKKYKQWLLDYLPDYVWDLVDIAAHRAATATLPAVRRAVQAALGAGLCPEDAVVLGSWLKEHGGAE